MHQVHPIDLEHDYQNTGQIRKLLGFHLSVDDITKLGFPPAIRTGVGAYWKVGVVPHIALAIIRRLTQTIGEYA
jgi:hypothetical protein